MEEICMKNKNIIALSILIAFLASFAVTAEDETKKEQAITKEKVIVREGNSSQKNSSNSNNANKNSDAEKKQDDKKNIAKENDGGEEEERISLAGEATVPAAKRPKAPDKEKASAAEQKDEKDTVEKRKKTFKFGVSEEIISQINSLMENEDPRFSEELYDLFQQTKNIYVREKILEYFTKLEDPCVSDYAVTILNDPFDERHNTVVLCINYLKAVKCKEVLPALFTLLEQDEDEYFNDAILAVGELGGTQEAKYLTQLFKDDDTPENRKQPLMRALGKIGATETWDDLVEISKNDEENVYVRMYAAEAIGNMKKPESVEVLSELFESTDPNLRQYVIKGLKNYENDKNAQAVIIQGIRDDYWRVRIECIQAAGEMGLKDAVDSIVYRAENDSENAVKKECWQVIAKFNTKEGNDFLVNVLSDKKKGDATKMFAAEALLKEGKAGEKEVIDLARESLGDDRKKQLRYNIGKYLVKYVKPSFSAICTEYLASKDAATVATGLDMYKAGKFSSAESAVRAIADDKKAGTNQKLAKRILGIEDDKDK